MKGGYWVLGTAGTYILIGVGVAAYSAYLGEQGKPSFVGFGSKVSAPVGLLENVFLWPYAMLVNVGLVKA